MKLVVVVLLALCACSADEEPSATTAPIQSEPARSEESELRARLLDGSLEARVAAARAAATSPVGARLTVELRNALTDREPTLRAEAARTLGLLKIEVAREDLVRTLSDISPDVRLEAMTALDRIAPGSLAGTTAVTALKNDPDTRVAQLAHKLCVR